MCGVSTRGNLCDWRCDGRDHPHAHDGVDGVALWSTMASAAWGSDRSGHVFSAWRTSCDRSMPYCSRAITIRRCSRTAYPAFCRSAFGSGGHLSNYESAGLLRVRFGTVSGGLFGHLSTQQQPTLALKRTRRCSVTSILSAGQPLQGVRDVRSLSDLRPDGNGTIDMAIQRV